MVAAIADKRGEIEAELNKDNLTPEQRRKAQKALDYLTKPTASATTTPTPEETPSPPAAPGASPTAESGQQKYGPVGGSTIRRFDDAKSTTPFERWIEARAKEKMGEHGTKMGLFISTLFSNLPYMMLCCIPLFALVLKVLHPAPLFYIDHLIYALHIHTFLLRRCHADCAGDDWAYSFRAGCSCRMADRAPMDRVCDADFPVNPVTFSSGLVLQCFQIPFWRICVSDRPHFGPRRHLFRHPCVAMKRNISVGRVTPCAPSLLSPWQLLPPHFFAVIGTSRLNENRLSG